MRCPSRAATANNDGGGDGAYVRRSANKRLGFHSHMADNSEHISHGIDAVLLSPALNHQTNRSLFPVQLSPTKTSLNSLIIRE